MIFNIPKNIILKSAVAFSFLLFFSSAAVLQAELLDRVVAIVNDDIITLSELEEAGKEFLQKIESAAPQDEVDEATKTAKETILSQLINQTLISQEAKKANVKLTAKEFENAYNKNIRSMDLTHEEWLEKLQETGLSEKTYKRNLRNQLLRDKLVLYEVRSRVIITEEMINEYYDNEYATEDSGGGYYLLQMGFIWGQSNEVTSSDSLMAADKARALKKAEEIHKLAVDGGNFSDLARQHSELPSAPDGGDLGVFEKDEMADYMRDAVLALDVGDVTAVLETPNVFQFFKLLSFQEGTTTHRVPLFEVKEEIRKELFEEKFKEEYTSWVEGIKEGAYIKKML